MANQLLLLGIAGGFAAALAMAMVISAGTSQSSAQMMNHQGGMMERPASISSVSSQNTIFSASGMSMINNVKVTGVVISGDNSVEVSLNYTGTGSAPPVTVIAMTNHMHMMQSTGMAGGMSGMDGGMGMMHGSQGSFMQPMMGSSAGGSALWQDNQQWEQWHTDMARWHSQLNSTQWSGIQALHNQMMAQGAMGPGNSWGNDTSSMPWGQHNQPQMQTGSSTLERGWTSSSLIVRLEGAGSAYDSKDIHVMVFPLTS